jgi:hypothetical protein
MKVKERPRKCPKLKEIKETGPWGTMNDEVEKIPHLGFSLTN